MAGRGLGHGEASTTTGPYSFRAAAGHPAARGRAGSCLWKDPGKTDHSSDLLFGSSPAPYFSPFLLAFLSLQRVLENDENMEEGNEEEDLEEDIPKRKNRTRGRVSGGGKVP